MYKPSRAMHPQSTSAKSINQHSLRDSVIKKRPLTSFTKATHLTCICFLSNASCNNLTTSCPTAFFAEKPLVHVSNKPESRAFCSTGKEKVSPRWIAGGSARGSSGSRNGSALSEAGIPSMDVSAPVIDSVKNASTESAR